MPDKKSKKPPRLLTKHLSLGIPTNVAIGPLGFRAELNVDPKGGRSRSLFDDRKVDRADSTTTPDEDNPGPSRVIPIELDAGSQVPHMRGGPSTAVEVDEAIEPGKYRTGECFNSRPQPSVFT